jgi:hypothetical protein
MFQEILALLVIFSAVVYAGFSIYKAVTPNKSGASGCAGCASGSCEVKSIK